MSTTAPAHAATMDLIEERLRSALDCEDINVVDESHLHVGHAGAAGGGGHFQVTVVAADFDGLKTLARHRLVYAAMAEAMNDKIHALTLNTLSPSEL